jgi:hypothetical protein
VLSDPTEALLEQHETSLPKYEHELESTEKADKPEFVNGRFEFRDEYRIGEIRDRLRRGSSERSFFLILTYGTGSSSSFRFAWLNPILIVNDL